MTQTITPDVISDQVFSMGEVERFPAFGPDGLTSRYYMYYRGTEQVGVPCTADRHAMDLERVNEVAQAMGRMIGDVGHMDARWASNNYSLMFKGSRTYEVTPGDDVRLNFTFRTGFDGRAALVMGGLNRGICANGLIFSAVAGMNMNLKIRHTRSLNWRVDLALSKMGEIIANAERLVGVARRASERTVSFGEAFRAVYPLADDASRRTRALDERRAERVAQRIWNERIELGRNTSLQDVSAWEMFNGIQGVEQHKRTRRPSNEHERIMRAADNSAVQRAAELLLV